MRFVLRSTWYCLGITAVAAIGCIAIGEFLSIKYGKLFSNPNIVIPCVVLFLLIGFISAHAEIEQTHQQAIKALKDEAAKTIALISLQRDAIRKQSEVWKASLSERSSGYPTLVSAIQEYEALEDEGLVSYLKHKSHPAIKAAETVSIYARRRREADHARRTTQSIIEYYEDIAPFLLDLKGDICEDDNESSLQDYSDDEKEDPVIKFVSKDEYHRLSSIERNQLALNRYWQRPKSKVHIGRMYERYIGYLYEEHGWAVQYTGIFKGLEDLGRDLVCTKDNRVIIVQCKYWSQFKTIYEKHIFQFFGTVFQYRDETNNSLVQGYFYTSTQVSALAKRFAEQLGLVLKESFPFDQSYPCIKCNVNATTRDKIYHLPFDQQYDNTLVSKPGECYCSTVADAEHLGFRRALRWKGTKGG